MNKSNGSCKKVWKSIHESRVVTIWRDTDGNEVELFPCDFASTGVPIDPETGEDLEYVETRVKI